MPVINLFTDFKDDPLYRGMLLNYLKANTNAPIVETTHFLPRGNLMTSSFIIKNLYKHFLAGTIHLVCTSTSEKKVKQYLAVELDGHIFIMADNGLVDLLRDDRSINVYSIGYKVTTFADLEIMAPAAVKIANGQGLAQLFEPAEDYTHLLPLRPVVTPNKIQGTVIYIDSYGNAMTNITRDLFEKVSRGRKYKIWVNLPFNITYSVDYTYKSSPGDFAAVFNYFGLLEVSVIYGNVAQLLKIEELRTDVIVEFL